MCARIQTSSSLAPTGTFLSLSLSFTANFSIPLYLSLLLLLFLLHWTLVRLVPKPSHFFSHSPSKKKKTFISAGKKGMKRPVTYHRVSLSSVRWNPLSLSSSLLINGVAVNKNQWKVLLFLSPPPFPGKKRNIKKVTTVLLTAAVKKKGGSFPRWPFTQENRPKIQRENRVVNPPPLSKRLFDNVPTNTAEVSMR